MAYVDTTTEYGELHEMMEYIKKCKLSYAMLESPTIYCEVDEDIWTSAIFNSGNKYLTFTLKVNDFSINPYAMNACFKLPENNCTNELISNDIVIMLNLTRYMERSTNNLEKNC